MVDKKIAVINIDCDDIIAGIIFNQLYNKFGDSVSYFGIGACSFVSNVYDVVVLISSSWEVLIDVRNRWSKKREVYVCGVCLGLTPSPLTELSNFMIHSGVGSISGLLYDVEAELEKEDNEENSESK